MGASHTDKPAPLNWRCRHSIRSRSAETSPCASSVEDVQAAGAAAEPGLPLFRFAPPDYLPVEDSVCEVDPTSPDGRLVQNGTADRSRPRACVNAHQDKLGNVLACNPISLLAELSLARLSCGGEFGGCRTEG